MSEIEHIKHELSDEEFSSVNGLTGIPHRIHWPATTDTAAPDYTEIKRVIIDNFLNTLAEIATAAANRKTGNRAHGQD